MRINFHQISSVFPPDINTIKEHLYGASEYIQSIFRPDIFRLKNTIEVKVRASTDPEENRIKIKNSGFAARLREYTKLDDKNSMTLKTTVQYLICIPTKPCRNSTRIFNAMTIYILKLLKSGNTIKIHNSATAKLEINARPENNIIMAANSDTKTNIGIHVCGEENGFMTGNPDINAAAWYFTRLESMGGSVNNYYNKSIDATGRTKVV